MRPAGVIGLVALAAYTASAEAQQRSPLPIEPGLTWTYRGYVRWTGPDGRVGGDSIRWTMKIVSVRTGPNARSAVVRGWVQDLAWHTPSKEPAYSLLVLRAGRLYHISTPDSAQAVALSETAIQANTSPPELSHMVLDSALTIGGVYGRNDSTSKRDDAMYGWHGLSERSVRAPAGWNAGTARVRCVTFEYRTLPDYQSIDVVSGVGITRFVYSHHGTIAEADVRLISVRR